MQTALLANRKCSVDPNNLSMNDKMCQRELFYSWTQHMAMQDLPYANVGTCSCTCCLLPSYCISMSYKVQSHIKCVIHYIMSHSMERVPFQCVRDIFSEFLNVFSTFLNQYNVFKFLSIVLYNHKLDL